MQNFILQQSCIFYFQAQFLQINTLLSEKIPVFFPICTFPQTTLEAIQKSPVMRGQTCFCQHYGIFRAATGGLLTPRTPVAHLAATSSARCLAFLTLERAHTRPYTDLRFTQIRPHTPGGFAHLRQGFAEPFRSVCRNVSGKLPSHPFAALTGLRGCAAGLLVSNIMP